MDRKPRVGDVYDVGQQRYWRVENIEPFKASWIDRETHEKNADSWLDFNEILSYSHKYLGNFNKDSNFNSLYELLK